MKLTILTPSKKLFEGEIRQASLPGTSGRFQVLHGHAPMVSTLAKGPVTYHTPQGQEEIHIAGGSAEVVDNKIVVLTPGTHKPDK